MKRRYIDGTGWKWLDRCASVVRKVGAPIGGYVSLIHILRVKQRLIVPSSGGDLCLADDDYRYLIFLPDGQNWCMTAMYDPQGQIIEWYFDITRSNGIDETGRPYYDDLYLDIVLLPGGETMIFDEDELKDALDNDHITQAEFDLAYRTSRDIIGKRIVSIDFMIPLCKELISFIGDDKGCGADSLCHASDSQ